MEAGEVVGRLWNLGFFLVGTAEPLRHYKRVPCTLLSATIQRCK